MSLRRHRGDTKPISVANVSEPPLATQPATYSTLRADQAAGHARDRYLVPQAAVERVQRVDALASKLLRAAAQVVDDAAQALLAGVGGRGRRVARDF